MSITALEGWTKEQTHAVAASYLAWTMDAFDFFILVVRRQRLWPRIEVVI